MLLFTSLSTAVYSSCALALAALVRLLFSTVFLSLLVSSLWMVSAEIHSLCWVFFLPRTSSHVSCQSFLQCSHCVSMSVSSSSISSCSGWNLLERLIWKAACVSLSLSSPTLYFVHVLLAVVNLLRWSLTVVIRRWWSDDTSAPLITCTCILPWSPELVANASSTEDQETCWSWKENCSEMLLNSCESLWIKQVCRKTCCYEVVTSLLMLRQVVVTVFCLCATCSKSGCIFAHV